MDATQVPSASLAGGVPAAEPERSTVPTLQIPDKEITSTQLQERVASTRPSGCRPPGHGNFLKLPRPLVAEPKLSREMS